MQYFVILAGLSTFLKVTKSSDLRTGRKQLQHSLPRVLADEASATNLTLDIQKIENWESHKEGNSQATANILK